MTYSGRIATLGRPRHQTLVLCLLKDRPISFNRKLFGSRNVQQTARKKGNWREQARLDGATVLKGRRELEV